MVAILLSRIRQLVKPGNKAWRWQMAHPGVDVRRH